MQKQEKEAPPQFMSTHPSVGLQHPELPFSPSNLSFRATIAKRPFVDGKSSLVHFFWA